MENGYVIQFALKYNLCICVGPCFFSYCNHKNYFLSRDSELEQKKSIQQYVWLFSFCCRLFEFCLKMVNYYQKIVIAAKQIIFWGRLGALFVLLEASKSYLMVATIYFTTRNSKCRVHSFNSLVI